MTDCEECGKELGILGGYRHPALGTGFLVCEKCFDKVDQDMKRWSEFCLSEKFNESSKIDVQNAWNKNTSNDPSLQRWFNLWIKKEAQTLED